MFVMERMTLNITELCDAIGCGKAAGYSLMRSKGFPSIKLGKKYLVSKIQFNDWLANYDKNKALI